MYSELMILVLIVIMFQKTKKITKKYIYERCTYEV